MALSVVAAAILVTSCVPRGAVVNVGGADVGVAERSEAIGAKSGLPDTAASDAGVIVDRAPHATRTPMSLAAPATKALPTATPTPEPTLAHAESADSASEDTPDESGVADVSDAAQPVDVASAPVSDRPAAARTGSTVALARVEDVDPAPPFVVLIDTVRLVDRGETYKVTGWIRNDGVETYEGIGLEATFYDGSDWHFGPFDATCGCFTLAPGQSCAFSVEAYARDYTGYRLHPEGSPLKAWTGSPMALTVTDAVVAGTEVGYVHLTGVVLNQTGSTVNTVRVSAELVDVGGKVTSVGTMIVVGQLMPGAGVSFSLRVPVDVYAAYTVSAEAELQ